MPDVRTTVTFEEKLYRNLAQQYKHLGFTRLGDLVNAAVREFLHRRRLQEKHRAMARAASDIQYRKLLNEISEEFREIDADGLGND